MNTTTRRYARTLAEAFPSDARHAYAIEHTTRSNSVLWTVAEVCFACLIGMGLAAALVVALAP